MTVTDTRTPGDAYRSGITHGILGLLAGLIVGDHFGFWVGAVVVVAIGLAVSRKANRMEGGE